MDPMVDTAWNKGWIVHGVRDGDGLGEEVGKGAGHRDGWGAGNSVSRRMVYENLRQREVERGGEVTSRLSI